MPNHDFTVSGPDEFGNRDSTDHCVRCGLLDEDAEWTPCIIDDELEERKNG